MNRLLVFLLLVGILTGCAAPRAQQPDNKKLVLYSTQDIQETETPPTIKTNQSDTFEERKTNVIEITKLTLETWPDVSSVNLIRANNGNLEIEFKTKMLSESNQPAISYDLMKILAKFFTTYSDTYSEKELSQIFGGNDKFTLSITTYSVDNQYRYRSNSSMEILRKINNFEISYEEWVKASNAGFR